MTSISPTFGIPSTPSVIVLLSSPLEFAFFCGLLNLIFLPDFREDLLFCFAFEDRSLRRSNVASDTSYVVSTLLREPPLLPSSDPETLFACFALLDLLRMSLKMECKGKEEALSSMGDGGSGGGGGDGGDGGDRIIGFSCSFSLPIRIRESRTLSEWLGDDGACAAVSRGPGALLMDSRAALGSGLGLESCCSWVAIGSWVLEGADATGAAKCAVLDGRQQLTCLPKVSRRWRKSGHLVGCLVACGGRIEEGSLGPGSTRVVKAVYARMN